MADVSQKLILGSGSRFRRSMLESAGIKFSVVTADVDETALKAASLARDPKTAPGRIALELAVAKARAVGKKHPDAWVIGCDQVLACRGEVFSKPPTLDDARQQLLRLRGQAHTLPTAVVLARQDGIVWSHVAEPRLTMRNYSLAFLDTYLAKEGDAVCETVGGYKLEGRGAQLFEAIDGDYFTIIGMPLLPLMAALRGFGLADT